MPQNWPYGKCCATDLLEKLAEGALAAELDAPSYNWAAKDRLCI
jgi:hypothetical protein